jgi:uncharacterized OB-fold protein
MAMRMKPSVSPDTAFFWDGLREHKLLIQRCASCGKLRHPPRPMCPHCGALEWDTVESTGRGVVHSWVMPRHPEFPWFEYPYIVVLVDLEEGTRLVSNLCEIDPDDVVVGMPVEVFYEQFDDDLVLALFRPAAG